MSTKLQEHSTGCRIFNYVNLRSKFATHTYRADGAIEISSYSTKFELNNSTDLSKLMMDEKISKNARGDNHIALSTPWKRNV